MKKNISPSWQDRLKEVLPFLGHRNWIVVSDSAYPWQTSPGIETICTEADHLKVVQTVLRTIDYAPHVSPIIHLDAELSRLPEKDAPGITYLRNRLKPLILPHTLQTHPHESIIKMLNAAGQQFRVLLLKTSLTLPYTSLFIQLDCGYWNAVAERRLRNLKCGL